jgi:hypothetical protein
MAREAPTGWSAANFLTRSGFVKDGEALFMNAWIKGPMNATVHVVSQGTAGSANHRRTLRIPGTPRASAESASVGSQTAATGTGLSTTNWAPVSAAFISATDRTAYHTDGNEATHNTVSIVPNTPDQLRIGLSHAGANAFFATGGIAEVSFWDIAGFSDAEVDSLNGQLQDVSVGTAANPIVINAQSAQPWTGKLLAYWPLDINAASPWNDESGGGHHLTMTGTLTSEGTFPPVDAASVTATLSGTIFGSGEPRMDFDIVAGGRTLVLTLANTTWVAAGATFEAQRQNVIDGLVADISPANGWNAEVSNLAVTDVVRTSDTVVTITLPALASYALVATAEVITATVPATAVASGQAIVVTPTFAVHPTIATTRRGTGGWGIASVPNPGGDYLTGPAFVTDDGFLVSIWIHQPDSIKGMPWQLGFDGVLSNHWRFITATSEGSLFHVGKYSGAVPEDPPTEGGAAQVNPILQDRWIHACGAWLSGSVKYAWLYGNLDDEGTHTEIATPGTPTSTRIGVRMDQADGMYPGDQLAELSVWDVSAMSIAEIRELVTRLGTLTDGLAPHALTVDADVGEPWTGKLISCPDLDFTSPTWRQDLSGNHAAYTEVGTLTEGASYPPVAEVVDAGTLAFDLFWNERLLIFLQDFYLSEVQLQPLLDLYLDTELTGHRTARLQQAIQDATDAMA